MKWSPEADKAMQKVPFFVRKKVRQKVEQYTWDKGKTLVGIADVKAAKKKFLSSMSTDIKGYQLDRCFGASGCPHGAMSCEGIMEKAEAVFMEEDILGFLKKEVKGDLKYHHEFRMSCADCPNGCSQPQIKDVGILGAVTPRLTDETCSQCLACVAVCPDLCISLDDNAKAPSIDFDACMMCGKCINACPSGTIDEGEKGFRVQLGGRLGRHPRLAMEIPRLMSELEVLEVLKRALAFYKIHSKNGTRFSKMLRPEHIQVIIPAK
ncbi:4Fe-4S dicluster domain-containing protein [Desulfocicer vacuolatum DSM 3385]|uniref:4Fe-4S dicluster domain-containing protein n=1 Tax=Desulfocicer vacuolatum DSM 3385 TaxID=1121400 RepID=A0A1W1YRB1_9BACT|nr:4Fe-4S dicluster domain-containing protein [Desulfocicer vacuolatum]SMC38745.1 4Fe-4S dicluster domain-containing protein [Desulfocicer vacuolatum DSM 3385]